MEVNSLKLILIEHIIKEQNEHVLKRIESILNQRSEQDLEAHERYRSNDLKNGMKDLVEEEKLIYSNKHLDQSSKSSQSSINPQDIQNHKRVFSQKELENRISKALDDVKHGRTTAHEEVMNSFRQRNK